MEQEENSSIAVMEFFFRNILWVYLQKKKLVLIIHYVALQTINAVNQCV